MKRICGVQNETGEFGGIVGDKTSNFDERALPLAIAPARVRRSVRIYHGFDVKLLGDQVDGASPNRTVVQIDAFEKR